MVAGLATISGNMLVVYATVHRARRAGRRGAAADREPGLRPGRRARRAADDAGANEDAAAVAGRRGRLAPRLYDSTMDAMVRGTQDGLKLLLGIMATLIVFVALVALVNEALEPLAGVTLQQIAGWVFWPLAWAMGVPAEAGAGGRAQPRHQGRDERVRQPISSSRRAGTALAERDRG